jgi:voltage-gated potassium channel
MTTSEPAATPPPTAPVAPAKGRFRVLRQVLQNALTLGGALLFYYFLPIGDQDRPIWRLALFVAGLGGLIILIVRQLARQLAAGSDPGVRVRSLIALLYPVIALFALAYYLIQTSDPTQFVDLETRTDALYYTVITLGTVGYGDVHAVGQLARVITMIQVAFDLVVIGALIAVATSRFQVVPRPTRTRRES